MELLFLLFILTTLIIPAFIANKIIFIILVIILSIKNRIFNIKIKTFAPLIIIAIFVYGFILSLETYSNFELSTQFVIFSFILILIYPLSQYDFEFDKLIKISGIILTVFSIFIYVVYISNINNYFISQIYTFLKNYGLIAIGYRGFFGTPQLFVHFGSVPFLFLSANLFLIDFLKGKKYFSLIIFFIMFLVILLSSLRALSLGLILSSVLLIVRHQKTSFRFPLFLAGSFIISIMLLYFIDNSTLFDLNDVSNRIKLGDAISFFNNINPLRFLFGNGLASYYYAGGRGFMISHTENTLLDSLRYFGFPLTIVMYYLLIVPSNKSKISSFFNDFNIIFYVYLFMSLSNPILFNSVGSLIILWYWYRTLKTINFKHQTYNY